MKTMILTVFAIVMCRAQAVSLRGPPSLVQVGFSLPQKPSEKLDEEAKTLEEMQDRMIHMADLDTQDEEIKTLEEMEEKMIRMAKSGNDGTPLKGFADLIKPHLDSMLKSINDGHKADQITLNSLGTAFATCGTTKATAESEASQLETTMKSSSKTHKDCRTAEDTAATNYANCKLTMDSLGVAKKTSCDAYNLANKVPNIDLVPKPGVGASYKSWLESVRDWVIAELNSLDKAKSACDSSTTNYDNKKVECEGADGSGGLKKAHTTKKTACNSAQATLETTSCSYAAKAESSCSQYGICYAAAKNAYDAGVSNLLKAQTNRVTEYNLVQRLICYCGLFSAAAGADLKGGDIDACKNKQHDTKHLQLTPVTVPAPPAACSPVAQRPCTASYLSAEYGSLPPNAQPAHCQPCPGGGPVEDVTCDFTVDNYVTKVYIDGSDKTSSVSGNLNSWPTKKSIAFKSSVSKLAFQVNDAEQGCRNGGFAISCNSKATAWTISSNSKVGWKVFSVKAGGSPSSISANQFPPAAGGKQWYETGYPEGAEFKEPRFGSTTYADRVVKTDGKNTEDFCGGDSDNTKNHWFFTYKSPLAPLPVPAKPTFAMPASGSLLLDFRGGVGVSSTKWTDQASGAVADVPMAVTYDKAEKAWLFPGKGAVLTVPMASNPQKMTAVTYAGWVKPLDYKGTLGWVLTQYPDFGWSRSITMSDSRLGGTGVTPGGYSSGLGNLPLNQWSHVAGVWTSRGGDCWIYANMKKYKRTCSNGQGNNNNEKFIIGGRGPNDSGHNAKVMVTDVGLWNKALTENDIKILYNNGQRPSVDTSSPVALAPLAAPPTTTYKLTQSHHCMGGSISKWASGESAAYGQGYVNDLDGCKATCSAHDDCSGFVLRDSDNRCSFWKAAPLAPKPWGGHHCYEKATR